MLNHKQNSQRKELQKLRRFKISNEPVMAENRAYISNLEKEITQLRSGKTTRESSDIIVKENIELRNQLSAIRKEKLGLEEEIENLEETLKIKNSEDSEDDLYNENLELKEEVKELAKENERLSKKRQSGRRPDWMSYIPYAEGDDLTAVKKAYRALAKGLHSDVSKEDDEKMKLINSAWVSAQDWFNSRDN
jgi:predicted mannosyl-3-phosphoglycerate phosphatase (HAD superfamily)